MHVNLPFVTVSPASPPAPLEVSSSDAFWNIKRNRKKMWYLAILNTHTALT